MTKVSIPPPVMPSRKRQQNPIVVTDKTETGYVTRAGLKLVGALIGAASQSNLYVLRLGDMTWNAANAALKELKKDDALVSTYGEPGFLKNYTTDTNEMDMVHAAQKRLAINDCWLWGEEITNSHLANYLHLGTRRHDKTSKKNSATMFAAFRAQGPAFD